MWQIGHQVLHLKAVSSRLALSFLTTLTCSIVPTMQIYIKQKGICSVNESRTVMLMILSLVFSIFFHGLFGAHRGGHILCVNHHRWPLRYCWMLQRCTSFTDSYTFSAHVQKGLLPSLCSIIQSGNNKPANRHNCSDLSQLQLSSTESRSPGAKTSTPMAAHN